MISDIFELKRNTDPYGLKYDAMTLDPIMPWEWYWYDKKRNINLSLNTVEGWREWATKNSFIDVQTAVKSYEIERKLVVTNRNINWTEAKMSLADMLQKEYNEMKKNE